MKSTQNRVLVKVLFSICLLSLPGKTTGTDGFADNKLMSISRFSSTDSGVNSTSLIGMEITSVPLLLSVPYCDKKPQFMPGKGTILTYLLRLKLCQIIKGRPWLDEECSRRSFSFITSYYELAYIKVCYPHLYQETCQIKNNTHPATVVRKLLELNNVLYDYKENINKKTNEKPMTNFPLHEEQSACFHIETYFQTLSRELANPAYLYANLSQNKYPPFYNVGYTEWFLTFREFCDSASCGVSENNYKSYSISAYDCVSETCKSVAIYEMIFDSLLAFIIVVANGLVLLVSRRTTVMKNIPGYFKMSLAVADMIIGAFVIPGVVYNHYVQTFQPLPYRQENQLPAATDYFTQHYINFLGVTINLSLFVSISTLCAACIDRYLAIAKPFKYENRKFFTKKKCFGTIIGIWFVGLLYAVLPIVVSAITDSPIPPYTFSGNDLCFWTGDGATITYSTVLGLSLIAVWVINIATLASVKSQNKRRKTSHNKKTVKSKRSLQKEGQENETTTEMTNQHDDNNTKEFLNVDDIDNREKTKRQERKKSSRIHTKLMSSMLNKTAISKRRGTTKSLTNNMNVERRLAKTLAIMIGALTLAILPVLFILALPNALSIDPFLHAETYSPYQAYVYDSLEYIFIRLFLSNSFTNCIIYSVRNRRFRKALVGVFICNEDARRKRRYDAENM